MSVNIAVRYDRKRGCGWRKEGGLYLVSGGLATPCGKLPIPLTVCPTCGCGIKFTRGWTWLEISSLTKNISCKFDGEPHCWVCPFNNHLGKVGLLWVGGKFYASPDDFTKEAAQQGVSRRIATIPHDFKLGETWVIFAHLKGISGDCECINEKGIGLKTCPDCEGKGQIYTPAIFHAFKPTAIEYVVKGNEAEEELEKLVKRGITPIRIEKIGETKELAGMSKE